MNPLFVELIDDPPPARPVEKPRETPPEVKIAEKTRDSADSPAKSAVAAPAPAAAAGKIVSKAPPEARATANLRPDPSAAPVAKGASSSRTYQTKNDSAEKLSEDALRAKSPPAGSEPSPTPRSAAPGNAADNGSSDPNAARTDSFNRAIGAASSSLAKAPAASGAGIAGGTGAAASGVKVGGTKVGGGDLSGGFDFGQGSARELLSSRKLRVPDRLLVGLPNEITTRVSFEIDKDGIVEESSIRFDPPVPDKVNEFLRAAFASWQFSLADSDGQVVFRYSIKVR
jgi:hypothetical protein